MLRQTVIALLLLVAAAAAAATTTTLTEWDLKRLPGREDLFVDLLISYPMRPARFLVDLRASESLIWGTRWTVAESATLAMLDDGTGSRVREWVHVGSESYAFEFLRAASHDPAVLLEYSTRGLLTLCEGRLGLGPRSEWWRVWNGVLLEYNRLALFRGAVPEQELARPDPESRAIQCNIGGGDVLCQSTEAGLYGPLYVFSNDSFVNLSSADWHRTVTARGVNLYASQLAEMPPIELWPAVHLRPSELLTQDAASRVARLLLGPWSIEGVSVGGALLRAHSVAIDLRARRAEIRRVTTEPHISLVQLLLVCAAITLWSVWILVPVQSMNTMRRGRQWRLLLELSSLLVAGAMYGSTDGLRSVAGGTAGIVVWIGSAVFSGVLFCCGLGLVLANAVLFAPAAANAKHVLSALFGIDAAAAAAAAAAPGTEDEETTREDPLLILLSRIVNEELLLLEIWLVLQESSATVFAVYLALLVTVGILFHVTAEAWLLGRHWRYFHYHRQRHRRARAQANAETLLGTAVVIYGGVSLLQLLYLIWVLEWMFWFQFRELIRMDLSQYESLQTLLGTVLKLLVVQQAITIASKSSNARFI